MTNDSASRPIEPFCGSYGHNAAKCPASSDPCAVCGREVKPGRPAFWAVVVDGGARFERANETPVDENDAGHMGLHVIGTDCARKLRAQGNASLAKVGRMSDRRPPMTTAPCQRCLKLAIDGHIRAETVMALPEGAFAPLGYNRQKCCFDCQSADNLKRVLDISFEARRIAVGNDRQEALRLPTGIVVADAMGLIKEGIVKNWPNNDDFEAHLKWLDQHVWPLIPEDEQ